MITPQTNLIAVQKEIQNICRKYGLVSDFDKVEALLAKIITNNAKAANLASELLKTMQIDFDKAVDLAYDLKINILDKSDFSGALSARTEINELPEISPLKLADELLAKLDNFHLEDPIIRKRFSAFLFSWLKEVRDTSQFKDAVTKAPKIGGVGMSEAAYNQLYSLLQAKKQGWQKNNINIQQVLADYEKQQAQNVQPIGELDETNIDVTAKVSPVAFRQENLVSNEKTIDHLLQEKSFPFAELAQKEAYKKQLEQKQAARQGIKNPVVEEITAEERFLESKDELAAPKATPAPRQNIPQPKPVNLPRPQIDTYSLPSQQQAATADFKQPMIKKTMPDSRPRMDDVKFTAQLYSPVEELGYLKIEDFRRLAKNPQEAAKKLMAKIDLMESESYTKRAEGISALKKSPLYKIYSEIMSQAIKEGKSIEQILTENPVISLAEFKAIMNLNKSLKY